MEVVVVAMQGGRWRRCQRIRVCGVTRGVRPQQGRCLRTLRLSRVIWNGELLLGLLLGLVSGVVRRRRGLRIQVTAETTTITIIIMLGLSTVIRVNENEEEPKHLTKKILTYALESLNCWLLEATTAASTPALHWFWTWCNWLLLFLNSLPSL